MNFDSILKGMATVGQGFGLCSLLPPKGGRSFNIRKNSDEARQKISDSIASDWKTVGEDLRKAMNDLSRKVDDKSKKDFRKE